MSECGSAGLGMCGDECRTKRRDKPEGAADSLSGEVCAAARGHRFMCRSFIRDARILRRSRYGACALAGKPRGVMLLLAVWRSGSAKACANNMVVRRVKQKVKQNGGVVAGVSGGGMDARALSTSTLRGRGASIQTREEHHRFHNRSTHRLRHYGTFRLAS